ncbi:MAG: hypothetical protein PWQ12_1974, partial [Clostridiales bacterium]|nr:hypothetical protein [Clostridiales bacterium]
MKSRSFTRSAFFTKKDWQMSPGTL